MVSLTLIAVGFLVVTAAVIALARGSTARWEQHKRAPVAARADGAARRTFPAGAALWAPDAMTRRGFAALRSQASRFPPARDLAQLLSTGMKQVTSPVRAIGRPVGALRSSLFRGRVRGDRWTRGHPPAVPVDGGGADMPLAPEPSGGATDRHTDGSAGATGRWLVRRTVRRAPRRALAFLHRGESAPDVRVPHEGSDETPTAR